MVAVRFLVEFSVDIPTLQSCIVSGEQDEINKTTKIASIITDALLIALKMVIPLFSSHILYLTIVLHNDDKKRVIKN